MKKLVLLVTLICVFSACKKSSNSTPSVTPITVDTGQYGTPFTGVPDPKDIVMYEVNIRSFSASDNFAGVEARLDSIKALGVNVIWLMPIYPIGQVRSINSPYSVQNDTAVNSEFGSLTDLRNFVSMAHADGMAVILDWVTDGTSFDNIFIGNKAWYDTSSAGVIQDYSGYTDVAKFNYTNPYMQAALIHGMEYWLLQANVDGFRCDNADAQTQAFWTAAISNISTLNHKLILLAESETYSILNCGFQMVYGWNYITSLNKVFTNVESAQALNSTNSAENGSIPTGTYILRFTSNHDIDYNMPLGGTPPNGTPKELFGSDAGALAAFVACATQGGVPLIYDGQEVSNDVPLDYFTTTTHINWSANNATSGAYEQIIAYRNANEAIKTGTLTDYSSTYVIAFEKSISGNTAAVLINAYNGNQTFPVGTDLVGTWKDAVTGTTYTWTSSSPAVSLSAYQYMLLTKQ